MNIRNIITEEIILDMYMNDKFNEGIYLSEMNNKSNMINAAIARLNQTSIPEARMKLASFIVALLSTVLPFQVNNSAAHDMANAGRIDIKRATEIVTPVEERGSDYSDPTKMSISEKGKELIKKHEGLRLKAYGIGDGKITIGYGHAEPKNNSSYQIGQKITKEEADRLFNEDIAKFEKAIRRMFRQWESQRGNEVFISQGMFDALISMGYNMGVGTLRNTDFIEKLEYAEDPKDVAELIKTTALKRGYSGLIKRRDAEYAHFLGNV